MKLFRQVFGAIVIILFTSSCAINPIKTANSVSKAFETKDSCDIFISDYKSVEKLYHREYELFEFQPNENVAIIGSADLFITLSYMCFVDDITFYVQDIDMKCLTEEAIEKGIEHFANLRGNGPLKGTIHLVQGEPDRSNLPYQTFDKVLLRLVYHEFKNPEKNLQDIYQILKPHGTLYVAENVRKKKNKKIKCGVERTEQNLISEIEKEGFALNMVVYQKGRSYKIFKFSKK